MIISAPFYYLPLQLSHSVCFGKLPPLHCLPPQFYLFVCGKAIFSIGITFLNLVVVAHHPQNQFRCLSLIHDQIMIELTMSGNVDERLATMIITTLPSWSWPWRTHHVWEHCEHAAWYSWAARQTTQMWTRACRRSIVGFSLEISS